MLPAEVTINFFLREEPRREEKEEEVEKGIRMRDR